MLTKPEAVQILVTEIVERSESVLERVALADYIHQMPEWTRSVDLSPEAFRKRCIGRIEDFKKSRRQAAATPPPEPSMQRG